MLQSSSLELLEAFAHSGSSSSTSVGGAELAQQRLRRYGAWDRNGNGRVGVNHLGLHDGYDMTAGPEVYFSHLSFIDPIGKAADFLGNVCKNIAGILTILRDREAKALVLQELREQVARKRAFVEEATTSLPVLKRLRLAYPITPAAGVPGTVLDLRMGDIYHCSTGSTPGKGWPTPELTAEVEDEDLLKREWDMWEEQQKPDQPSFRLPDAVEDPKAFGWEMHQVKDVYAEEDVSHFRQMVESLLQESSPEDCDSWMGMGYTTAMLRNLPNKYMRDKLVSRLNTCGYKGDIDFLYLPIDFRNKCNVGYCFLNFRTSKALVRFRDEFHGRQSGEKLPGFNSKKVLEVSPARVQGLHPNIVRLQGSPIMARAMEREWLPVLLDPMGRILDFPMVMPQAAEASQGHGRRVRRPAGPPATEIFQ
ncbi:Protein MEI2-like 3 (AML3) (MEI2-like protein 3) [Durusdinium trenchii]|uniref:Protein MEI2-like 3 (AML3) (MEI2-like protein 3) n=1 Tax=Durusdinium trenchii TaxID=1381693 RepID=A0ABP0Q005_9DINO